MNTTGRSSRFVTDLIEGELHGGDAIRALKRFAAEFGWRPSDQIDRFRGTEEFSNGHLIVEHGLDQTAVISFLRSDSTFSDLRRSEKQKLLELSYNNLVDWHFLPERNGMRVVFNRIDPIQDQFFPITTSENSWRAENFELLTGRRPNPNVIALDDALIATISFWKRAIQSDLGNKVTTSQISSLMNTIILARALEDYHASKASTRQTKSLLDRLGERRLVDPIEVIRSLLVELSGGELPRWIKKMVDDLRIFRSWGSDAFADLVRDFYRCKYNKFEYNFHLISKHALSRIYEHYVSVLRTDESKQLYLFNPLPTEVSNRDLGSYYTPQYIARFFSRFLRENTTPRRFRSLRTLDPACGSGMFLRTLLEMQCDPSDSDFDERSIDAALSSIHGIDVDDNACQAARLSLSLLALVLTGKFPDSLNIENLEALTWASKATAEDYEAIIANPPFLSWDRLTPDMRSRLMDYLQSTSNKPDLYLAFLKIAIEKVNSGGFLCFVLPHSFLIADNAGGLRKLLSEQFAVRVVADLSAVPVFGNTSIYVVLLIAEKVNDRESSATVIKCRDFVGSALHDALQRKQTSTAAYDVFEVPQSLFTRERWQILPPAEERLRSHFSKFPRIEEFLEVRQGVTTGYDSVFFRKAADVPAKELAIWPPLLNDREMARFAVPAEVAFRVFMPFAGRDKKLTGSDLENDFPHTWKYLNEHRTELEKRKVANWWEPTRPRSPAKLLVPKIVTPHLVLLPKFGIDIKGQYAVTRSPYLVPKVNAGGTAFLKVVCAVLNSAIGHWQLSNLSHRYRKGYLMLEVKTLRDFVMPSPSDLSPSQLRKLIKIFDKLALSPTEAKLNGELDELVCEIYGMSRSDIELIGL